LRYGGGKNWKTGISGGSHDRENAQQASVRKEWEDAKKREAHSTREKSTGKTGQKAKPNHKKKR